MWVAWHIDTAAALLAAGGLALALAVPLSMAAWRLPRALGAVTAAVPPLSHRRLRLAFLTAAPLLAMCCAWRFGATGAAAAAIVCALVLLALAWIDAETGLLPDRLTIPLLWLGLLVNLHDAFTPLADAVTGAAAGYLTLYCVQMLFLWLTGRQGLGFGDCKLLAALGAWLGWAALPRVLLAAATLGLAVALARRLAGNLAAGAAFSFGPYLAAAGLAALLGL
jgi:leader peptidase (prepilin peptidase)/N-methyltransferase